MLHSYFTTAWRNLLKNKVYTTINIIGLGLALSAALFIFNYVSYEKSYDQFHVNKNNIYRVTSYYNPGKAGEVRSALTLPWTGPGAQLLIAEIEDFARIAAAKQFTGKKVIRYNDTRIVENRVFMADASFLSLFSFDLVSGSKATALKEPFSMVLTESIAKKYFGSPEAIMNKVVVLEANLPQKTFKITGIIKDPPPNSHLQFDVLLSFNSLYDYWYQHEAFTLGLAYTHNYIRLKEGADPVAVGKKMSRARDSLYHNETYKQYMEFVLQPLTDIHLDAQLTADLQRGNSRRLINLLLLIGVFILLLAYINYINIAVAKSFERAKEIGIRKTFGAGRFQLMKQFLSEVFIVNSCSVAIAVLFSLALTPVLERLLGIGHLFSVSQWTQLLVLITILIIIGTLVSGLYPAFILSSFKPVDVLKEQLGKVKGLTLRKVLVVAQFMAGILLLSGALAVFKQLQYMKDYDIGANLQHTMVIEALGTEDFSRFEQFKNELCGYSTIQSISTASVIPGDEGSPVSTQLFNRQGVKTPSIDIVLVDKDLFRLMNVDLVGGRPFDLSANGDSMSIMLNEAAATLIGFDDPVQAVNQYASWPESMWVHGGKQTRIIGVVGNYYQQSMKVQPKPLIYMPRKYYNNAWTDQYFIVRFQPGKEGPALDLVRAQWAKLLPGEPFNYFFLEDHFNRQYEQEEKFLNIFSIFTILAISIATMGLYGLSAFTILQRTREIAIRKVLAASNTNIFALLAADYFKLVLVAYLLAVPVGYHLLTNWLQNYPYRISIGLWFFLFPGIVILLVAMLSIAQRIFKASRQSPVKALRSS